MKKISIVTACYNEQENVAALCETVNGVFSGLPEYTYEHIFIDNASSDDTVKILKSIARNDKRVKIIVNSRNFGHIRSPFHGILQASGEAVISLVADFQDPPSMIIDFLKKWEEGYMIVVGVKTGSKESKIMFMARKLFYNLIKSLSDIDQIKDFTGFGLYDKKVIEILRTIDDPYPYFRGLIADIGFAICKIGYTQPVRAKGWTKNNFYTLYDMAMLGITNHSKAPLRLATMLGFSVATGSIIFALIYFIYKLIYWSSFTVGIAPLVIGLFLLFIGTAFFHRHYRGICGGDPYAGAEKAQGH